MLLRVVSRTVISAPRRRLLELGKHLSKYVGKCIYRQNGELIIDIYIPEDELLSLVTTLAHCLNPVGTSIPKVEFRKNRIIIRWKGRSMSLTVCRT